METSKRRIFGSHDGYEFPQRSRSFFPRIFFNRKRCMNFVFCYFNKTSVNALKSPFWWIRMGKSIIMVAEYSSHGIRPCHLIWRSILVMPVSLSLASKSSFFNWKNLNASQKAHLHFSGNADLKINFWGNFNRRWTKRKALRKNKIQPYLKYFCKGDLRAQLLQEGCGFDGN